MFSLKGKKAIVTGAAQGLGKEMARALHAAGAEVVILDVSDLGKEAARELGKEDAKVHFVKGNLLDRENLISSFKEAVEKLEGRVDILLNSAGVIERKRAMDLSLESWDRILEINVSAVFQLSCLAADIMINQGSGKIINMGSILSFLGGYNAAAYSTSKGAIAQLTKSLSNEWAGHGIQVNAIAPGYMSTSMNADIKNDEVRTPQINARIPAGRWGTPEDVAGVAIFLASAASDYVTGVVIPVDGGVLGR
ncbi:2-deoxy-D-gluconate 3-dehydrogenase [Heyndrickxia sporothermodurans]|nr:2-deoxy-D-gluconate 3-dehydrogenase [Heyndrickxia sporothermodurans]